MDSAIYTLIGVAIGAAAGLAGSIITSKNTYKIETAKMKANHRAEIIKDVQITAHDYFTSIKLLLLEIYTGVENKTLVDEAGEPSLVTLEDKVKSIEDYQVVMHRKVSQLKSIGLKELAAKASKCVEPMESFVSKPDFTKIMNTIATINTLEDEFIDSIANEYIKLKL
ncbi:hypothetical protein EXU30_00400 [Shewanella maritima]|uniref:Uncharacterized protein n=1 Tax=Shewanella maritima TaxID=2520507 RepID=A0A411PCT0_9GAMM|nr:hypothetical protein [Shewanella maritima]QBF81323.1 hypothetical protein EXU30_00370 [Shewanella maritima]QBF81328.1 hypothetical protein EXU30_00400 [Shewanella maritima]